MFSKTISDRPFDWQQQWRWLWIYLMRVIKVGSLCSLHASGTSAEGAVPCHPCLLIAVCRDDYKKRSMDDSSSKSESDSLGIYEHVDPIKFTDDGSFAEHVGAYRKIVDDEPLEADVTATSALSSLVWTSRQSLDDCIDYYDDEYSARVRSFFKKRLYSQCMVGNLQTISRLRLGLVSVNHDSLRGLRPLFIVNYP